MKKRLLPLLLTAVMILSAFAGTFVIHAEEEATALPWEINGTYYATYDDAVNAAMPGDTIRLHADTTNEEKANELYLIRKDVTFEGVQKPDGTYPTLGVSIQWRRYGLAADGDDSFVEVKYKNININFIYIYNFMYDVQSNCSLTFENVNFTLTQSHTYNVYGSPFRVSGSDAELTFINCNLETKSLFYPPTDVNALIHVAAHSADNTEVSGSVVTLDTCNFDLTESRDPCSLVHAEDIDNVLVLRNSIVDTRDDCEMLTAEGITVDYRGTNNVNGQITVNEDIDYLIYDKSAREAGYVARVGEVKEAVNIKDDGSVEYIGYYKDLVAACNAAAATETTKQKTVVLIENVTVENILTLPGADIDGANKTLTAGRIYKAPDAILTVADLTIKTTAAHPILQMNADSEELETPGYAKFTNCTFESNEVMPYAYFVLQADLILDRCEVIINNTECDKPLFRLDKGADITLAGTKINIAETAPNVSGFDVVDAGGSLIMINGATSIELGQSLLTASPAANGYLNIGGRATISSSEADTIVLPATATGWGINVGGSAVISSAKGSALSVAVPNTGIDIDGTAKLTAAKTVLHAAGDGVTFKLAKDVVIELINHARNDAAILLEGAGSKLVSEGTISIVGTRTKYASLRLSGAGTSALIKGGAITGTVQIGTADNAAAFVMTGGTITAFDNADAAIVVNNGSADVLSGTLSGGAKAIAGTKEVAYAEGETSIVLNELYANIPLTVGVSLRMNDGSLGMRFASAADAAVTAYAEALKAAGAITDYEFGTLIVRATEIRSREMTVAALSAEQVTFAAVKADAGLVTAEDGSISYTAAIINFTEDNMGMGLVGRAYVKYTLIDGSLIYVYAEDHTEGISLGELAQKALADVSKESAEGYRNRVESFYEADEDGWYELIEEAAYSPYSKAQQAALKAFIEGADL